MKKQKKEYYDAELDKILTKYITKEQYKEFVPMLKEIFQRRAYEFGFSTEHMKKEVQNFVEKCKRIEIKNEKSSRGGSYYWIDNKIDINIGAYSKYKGTKYEKLFKTLTHEVYHAISDVGEKVGEKVGLSYKGDEKDPNSITKKVQKGVAITEVFTEAAAARATLNRDKDDFANCNQKTIGYPNITFIASMLSSSIGVSEKEMLKAGIQNRENLMELFESKFPDTQKGDFAKEWFKEMESNLDIIYNVQYVAPPQGREEVKILRKLVVETLGSLYTSLYQISFLQIENDERNISQEYSSEVEYRFAKMEIVMQESLKQFCDLKVIFPEQIEQIKNSEELKKIREELAEQMLGIKAIAEQGDKITDPKEAEEILLQAKQGDLTEKKEELEAKYGIKIPEVNIEKFVEAKQFQLELDYVSSVELEGEIEDPYTSKILKEDFDNGNEWDNKEFAKQMKRIIRKSNIKNMIESAERMLKGIMYKEPKYPIGLNPPKTLKELPNTFDGRYVVNPEDLTPIENGGNKSKETERENEWEVE